MGVDWEDCGIVGELLGIKTFANEFIAYLDLSDYIKNAKEDNGGRTISVSSLWLSQPSWLLSSATQTDHSR